MSRNEQLYDDIIKLCDNEDTYNFFDYCFSFKNRNAFLIYLRISFLSKDPNIIKAVNNLSRLFDLYTDHEYFYIRNKFMLNKFIKRLSDRVS